MTMEPGTLDPVLLRNFALALFIGALVGVDREHRATEGSAFGGLRTFMLIALVGAVAVWLGGILVQPWLPLVGLVGVAALLAVSYPSHASRGLTSEIAALVVYLLGAACVAGQPEIAVVLGIATSALLTFRKTLHDLAAKIGPEDLGAGLKLLFATFIVLPLLPNEAIDPLGALNPYRLWWLVVLISALSLLGYVAVRWLGQRRGLALTGLFGGLVSSTAVTLSSARQSLEEGANPDALALSVLIAWAVMFVRVVIEVAVVNPSLLGALAAPMIAMSVAAGAGAGLFAFRGWSAQAPTEVALRNPFSLWEATKFAMLFAAVLLVVALARKYLDAGALYAVAALAGTTDVDAITLSLAEQAGTGLAGRVATVAIAVATVSNTLVKCGMAMGTGARPFASRIGIATAGIVAVGLITALLS